MTNGTFGTKRLSMVRKEEGKQITEQVINAEDQPSDLQTLFKELNVVRRQFGLYGPDHPNAKTALSNLVPIIAKYVKNHGPSTFVFTKQAVIVNDHCYKATEDSIELCTRLRARGCMAVTLLQDIPQQQLNEFFLFLNVEPQTVILEGGPSTYLRSRGVSRIVVTEAVYTTGDDSEAEARDSRTEMTSQDLDRALVAVIDWLSRRDDDNDSSVPHLPIDSLLSDPNKGAKLIREAVTKLHTSRRALSTKELSAEAINDLKELASSDPEKWDEATPQIRKAVLKLPREMRPVSIDFGAEEGKATPEKGKCAVDVAEVEALLSGDLGGMPNAVDLHSVLGMQHFDMFFGVKAIGLISSWQKELEPAAFVRSSGNTFALLMAWEGNASEHGRIARALANLIPRAVEVGDPDLALELADKLVKEAEREDNVRWRTTNVVSALQAINVQVLVPLVKNALENDAYRPTAASLLRMLPQLALNLADLLCTNLSSSVRESLKQGIALSGRSAIPVLGRILVEGTPVGRESAFQVLIDMKNNSAFAEIERALGCVEPEFQVRAFDMLGETQSPLAVKICLTALESKFRDVRCAAIRALGKLGASSAVWYLVPFAAPRLFSRISLAERTAAIYSLGQMAGADMLPLLEKIANHRPIFRRQSYESIRQAAYQAIANIKSRLSEGSQIAA
jgi:HEAT repeat protein